MISVEKMSKTIADDKKLKTKIWRILQKLRFMKQPTHTNKFLTVVYARML